MKIKQVPEDFIVKEAISLKKGDGLHSYYKLIKRKWNTIDAIKAIADKLGIKRKFIFFAGIKDKNALTEQHISILNGKESFENIQIKEISLKYIGKGSERVHQGLLKGNEFTITVRDLEKEANKIPSYVPNYFDEQRFGQGNNRKIGKSIVKGDFQKACELLDLKADKNDYLGKLKFEKKDLIPLYLHSYQSWLFNEVLTEYLRRKSGEFLEVDYSEGKMIFPKENHKNFKIPLINFDTEFENEEIEQIYENLLEKEGINKKDFIIRQMPELTSITIYRDTFMQVKKFEYKSCEKDELNKGKLKQIIHFELPKGSYATVVIKSIYGPFN